MIPLESVIGDDDVDSLAPKIHDGSKVSSKTSRGTVLSVPNKSSLTLPDSRVAFLPRSLDVVSPDSPLMLEARIVEEAFRVVTD